MSTKRIQAACAESLNLIAAIISTTKIRRTWPWTPTLLHLETTVASSRWRQHKQSWGFVLGLVFPFTDSALLLSGRQRSAMTIKKGFLYSPRTLHSTLQHELHAGGTECRARRSNHTYLYECMFCNLIFLHGRCLQIIISRRLPLLVKYSCWGCSTLSHPSIPTGTRSNDAVPLLHYSQSNERPTKCNSGRLVDDDGDLLCIPRSMALFVCHWSYNRADRLNIYFHCHLSSMCIVGHNLWLRTVFEITGR